MDYNRYTRALVDLDTFYVFEDFAGDQLDANFIDTITDSGSAVINDAVSGVITLTPSDGTVADNDECYIASSNELFLYQTNKSIYGKCRLRFTETTATVYNVAFGFQNTVGANTIIDDGGGLKVSGSTLGIYKVDGSAVWKCVSSCNGTSTVSTSTTGAVGSTWYTLEIECQDYDGTNMKVTFKVDGQYLRDSNNIVISHSVAIASATEMQVFAGCKLGAATNNDTTLVDYIYASQKR